MTASGHHRETADDYRDEIFRHGSFRVILCKDGIQWILQRSRAASGNKTGVRWEALSYCTTRHYLQRDWTRHSGAEAVEIDALPEHTGRANRERV